MFILLTSGYANRLDSLDKMGKLFEQYSLFIGNKLDDLFQTLPSPLKDAVEVSTWRRCYTMQEVN